MPLRRQLLLLAVVLSVFLVTPPVHAAGRTIGTPRWDSPSGGVLDLAASRSTFLSAWKPSLSRTIYVTYYDQDGYATRQAIPIATAPPLDIRVRVVPLGDGYAVLWQDSEIHMVVVDATGTPGPAILLAGTERLSPEILSDGKRVVLVGQTGYPRGEVSIVTLDATGVASWRRIPLPTADSSVMASTLVANDVAVVIRTQTTGSRSLVRVSATGTIVSSLPGGFYGATAAAAGNDVVVVWSDLSAGTLLQSTVVKKDGAVTETIALPTGGFVAFEPPRAVTLGDHIFLTFRAKRSTSQPYATDVLSLLLATDGSPVEVEPRSLASGEPSSITGIAVQGTNALLALASSKIPGLFLRTSPAITVETRDLTSLPAQETRPSIASDGVNFLAVWNTIGGKRATIVTSLLDSSGTSITPASELSSSGEAITSQSVAFGAGQYLVASSIEKSIALRRINAAGVVVDRTPVFIERPTTPRDPVVASDGQRFLVAWLEQGLVMGTIVAPDGTWSTPRSMTFEPPRTSEAWPRVAFNGKVYLLSYGAAYPDPSPFPMCCSVFMTNGVRVAPDAEPIDKTPIKLMIFGQSESPTSLAGGGGQFFAVRQENNGSVRGVMVQADASSITVNPPRTYFDWFGFVQPSVSWSGSAFTLLMRYSQFLGKMQVSLNGTPGTLRATSNGLYQEVAGVFDSYIGPPAPSSATSLSGRELILNAEIRPPAQTYQIVAYQPSELLEVQRPNAPEVDSVLGSSTAATVRWTDRSTDEEGFLVETSGSIGQFSYPSVVPANTTSATVRSSFPILSVRVRSFNAAGISAPSREVAPVAVRKRTVK